MTALDLFPEVQLEPDLEPDERYTPRYLYQPLHQEFRFTLDVCATAESAKCFRYFTARDDGLVQSWEGERVWCNPKYSDIEPWVRKAWVARAELVAMLLPSNRTEQPWWQQLVEPFRDGRAPASLSRPVLRTRFLSGRIRFGFPGNPDGAGVGSPPFGCVLLLWTAK